MDILTPTLMYVLREGGAEAVALNNVLTVQEG